MIATAAKVQRPCGKCSGRGVISAFRNVQGGVCFTCTGAGTVEAPANWREREVKAEARRHKAQAARLARSAGPALWAAFADQYPAEAALIWARRDEPAFGGAYSAVATYSVRDSNPAHALRIAREEM